MTTNQTAAELLRTAAHILDRDGWAQGTFGDETRGWCTVGAIQHAAAFDKPPSVAIDDAMQAVTKTVHRDGYVNIGHWNDHPNRTKHEVIDTLRRTADQLTRKDQP